MVVRVDKGADALSTASSEGKLEMKLAGSTK
jgi:hypothetical protein